MRSKDLMIWNMKTPPYLHTVPTRPIPAMTRTPNEAASSC